jgi:hypothetical protein
LELKFDSEKTINLKRFSFIGVLCKKDARTATYLPIEFERNQIDKILAMYELNPELFDTFAENKLIDVKFNKRLNPNSLVYSHLIEKNKLINKESQTNQKSKPKSHEPKVIEDEPNYPPYDAMNRRLKGSYW